MKVRIGLAGLLAASAGFRERAVELPDGATVEEAMRSIGLPVSGAWTLSSVNGRLRDKAHVLQDNDELLLFPIGGGG